MGNTRSKESRNHGVEVGESNGSLVMLKESKVKASVLDLQSLQLSQLNVQNLASGLGKYLREINLSCNELTDIQELFLALRDHDFSHQISNLNLSSNKFSSLSLDFFPNLLELDLKNNNLQVLPKSITNLSRLELLDVSNNQLISLPNDISKMEALVTLELNNNKLTCLPAAISKLKHLRTLSLEDCPLIAEAPPQTKPSSLPSLRELSARVLVRHGIPVSKNSIPVEVSNYLESVNTCTFCNGPYFEHFTTRYRFVTKGVYYLALEHSLCTNHWDSEKKRILSIFLPSPSTAPQKLPSLSSTSSPILSTSPPNFPRLRKPSLPRTSIEYSSSPRSLISIGEYKSMSRNNSNILRESH